MKEEKIVLLGEKNYRWKIKVILLAPLWFFWPNPPKKSWKEFSLGLIKHKCEYDYDNPQYSYYKGKIYMSYPCKHYGCNFVKPGNVIIK